MHDEFAAALQFPDCYGANWDALVDCLGDLSTSGGLTLVITDPADVLLNGGRLDIVVSILRDNVAGWTDADASWRQVPTPLHVVLSGHPTAELRPVSAGAMPTMSIVGT